ncbi:MAG: Lrp/AsnC family transcriptional regulator [Syntrophomonadaceae bacterium]|nr:Lrp/AsnC family transcriptional regulator [Syntrophomonadaceae bacterium]
MDKIDRQILDILQQEYPLDINPYKIIAQKIGISEAEVINRIRELKNQGIIRRIGAVFDARKMGFYSTLCATSVEENRIDEVAAIINRYDGVTHNYVRDHSLNIWFTLTASSYEKAMEILKKIENEANIKVYSMPSKKMYKIRVALEMGDS